MRLTTKPTPRVLSIKDFNLPLLIFIGGTFLLEVQFNLDAFKLGNVLLLLACVSAILIVVARKLPRPGLKFRLFDIIYFLYLAWATLSATWSPSPVTTIVGVVYMAGVWLGSMFLARANIVMATRYVVVLAVITALLSFASIPISPSYAFQPFSSGALPELRGIMEHQLRLGLCMSIACAFIAIAYFNGDLPVVLRKRRVLAMLIIAVCLVAAFARLYTASMIIALLVTIGVSKPGPRRVLSVVFITAIVALIYFNLDMVVELLGEGDVDLTLTGRTLVWEHTLAHANANPWFGYGYSSYENPVFDFMFDYYRPAHPHNAFLQAYFETGLVGLTLTVLLVLSHLASALRVSRKTGKYSYTLFLVLLATLGSLGGSNYAGKPTMLFSLLMLSLAIEARQTRTVTAETPATGRSRLRLPPGRLSSSRFRPASQ